MTTQPICKIDNAECNGHGYYRVGTSPDTGPAVAFADRARGIYCLNHARQRAAVLMVGWRQRRATKLAEQRMAHDTWRAQYEADNTSIRRTS